ncbi:hypothetical protein MCOR10_009945 [Pyricularia oryzae]|nr:hypothetical protein MCOR10_009945 [Pyricularia oryzae]
MKSMSCSPNIAETEGKLKVPAVDSLHLDAITGPTGERGYSVELVILETLVSQPALRYDRFSQNKKTRVVVHGPTIEVNDGLSNPVNTARGGYNKEFGV